MYLIAKIGKKVECTKKKTEINIWGDPRNSYHEVQK